ncbi:hypothetical protein DC915_RS01590 [Vibrio parahaemolyticus]|nr:hypothetical protein [Vibrio parahaemolyticus]EJG0009665.1 hypothetical protein [Vibrio parahaemolyticus]
MKYHQPTKSFVIEANTIERVAESIKYSLKMVREAGGKPLKPYDVNGMMDDCDHAQATIMDIADALDIDLGHRRFNMLDLSTSK